MVGIGYKRDIGEESFDQGNLVRVRLAGETASHTYVHTDLWWMHKTSSLPVSFMTYRGRWRGQLAWERVSGGRSGQATGIWRFTLMQSLYPTLPPPLVTTSLVSWFHHPQYFDELDAETMRHFETEVQIKIQRVQGSVWGLGVWIEHQTEAYSVPRALFLELCSATSGNFKTQEEFAKLRHMARARLRFFTGQGEPDKARIGAAIGEGVDTLPMVIASLALVTNLQKEVMVARDVLGHVGPLISEHREALTLKDEDWAPDDWTLPLLGLLPLCILCHIFGIVGNFGAIKMLALGAFISYVATGWKRWMRGPTQALKGVAPRGFYKHGRWALAVFLMAFALSASRAWSTTIVDPSLLALPYRRRAILLDSGWYRPFTISRYDARTVPPRPPFQAGDLVVTWSNGLEDTFRRRVQGTYIYGTVVAGRPPMSFDSNVENEEAALRGRCGQEKPKLDPEEFARFKAWVLENLEEIFEGPINQVCAVPFEEWNSRFPPGRRLEQERLRQRIRDGLEERHPNRHNTKFSIFIKREVDLGLTVDGDADKFPRLIQSSHPVANLALGPWVYAFSKELTKRWGRDSPICYASGMDAIALGEWMSSVKAEFAPDQGVESDFSKFDSTVHLDFLRLEHDILVRFGLQGVAAEFNKAHYKKKGASRHGLRYKVPGQRASGVPATSAGNSMINGLVNAYVVAKWAGNGTAVPYAKIRDTTRIIVMGDDGMTFSKSIPSESFLKASLEALGLKVTPQYRWRWCDYEFCSGMFAPAVVDGKEGLVLAPKPGRIIPKLGATYRSQPDAAAWMRSACLNYNILGRLIPTLSNLVANRMRLLGRGPKARLDPREVAYKIGLADPRRAQPSPGCVEFMVERYGVTVEEIADLSAYLDNVPVIKCLIAHSTLDRLIAVDSP